MSPIMLSIGRSGKENRIMRIKYLSILIVLVCFISTIFAGDMKLKSEDVLDIKSLKPQGKWYEATMPDTLDLAQRAKYSVNVLTGNLDPTNYYAVWNSFFFDSHIWILHEFISLFVSLDLNDLKFFFGTI